LLCQSIAVADFSVYRATDLGTLGTGASTAAAINNSGQIVGTAAFGNVDYFLPPNGGRGFVFDGVVTSQLDFQAAGSTFASGIDESGQIIGAATQGSGLSPAHAILDDHGIVADLGGLGGYGSVAVAINASGEAAGFSSTPQGNKRAFLYFD
jgi:uncharacterized membrane protein